MSATYLERKFEIDLLSYYICLMGLWIAQHLVHKLNCMYNSYGLLWANANRFTHIRAFTAPFCLYYQIYCHMLKYVLNVLGKYEPRAMPSSGVFPFMQSYVCNLDAKPKCTSDDNGGVQQSGSVISIPFYSRTCRYTLFYRCMQL